MSGIQSRLSQRWFGREIVITRLCILFTTVMALLVAWSLGQSLVESSQGRSTARLSGEEVIFVVGVAVLMVAATSVTAQQNRAAPDRQPGVGEGPFDRLVIRGITMIDGTGAPPQGPMDIVIQGNRITEVRSVGYPLVPINQERRPATGTKEIDGTGMYIMPGFVDLHTHCGGAQAPAGEHVDHAGRQARRHDRDPPRNRGDRSRQSGS